MVMESSCSLNFVATTAGREAARRASTRMRRPGRLVAMRSPDHRLVAVLLPPFLCALAFACDGGRSAPNGGSMAPPPAVVQVDTVVVPPAIRAVVDAPDRSAADRALDPGRHPGETLTFFGVQPGARVAELGAGGGYTSELLARTVGPSGVVFGQNTPFILKRFAEQPWSARLAKPAMGNVIRVDRDFDDPLPPEAHDLDAVLIVLFYHDTVWMGVDRATMNRAVFRALRPGGIYAIVDHSARVGSGSADAQTFHRIDEQVVREEVTAAGFELVAEASFLRNPSDRRDWNDSPTAAAARRGTSDRFVLEFVKPLGSLRSG
jgi:predicted methyltransferase